MKNDLAIVIPAYKISYLKAVLTSIASQTNKNFRLYIGDDCSPNNLLEVIDDFTECLDIKYVRFNENLGGKDLVGQWERCIDLVENEEWIWLFSDDDIMEETCVENFYRTLQLNLDFDIYRFDVKVINDEGAVVTGSDKESYPEVLGAYDFYEGRVLGKYSSYVVEYIFNRKRFFEVGRFQNFDLAWSSDVATWIKLSVRKGIYTIGGTFIRWRRGAENISPNKSNDMVIRKINALLEFLAWCKAFFDEHGRDVSLLNLKILSKRLYSFSPHVPKRIIRKSISEYASQTNFPQWTKVRLYSILGFRRSLKRIYGVLRKND